MKSRLQPSSSTESNRCKLSLRRLLTVSIRLRAECFSCPCLQVLIPFAEDGSVDVEQNHDLPDYLPEDESPSQEPDKAVTRVGSGQDGATWLGAAANFLSRSFYW